MLKRVTQSPFLNLITGIILLITAGSETVESMENFTIGVHHGILVFSIFQILKAIPEIMHGFQELEEAKTLKQAAALHKINQNEPE